MLNFNEFAAVDYLDEYYSLIGPENNMLLQFWHESYAQIGLHDNLLEFGGGPSICSLLSASNYATNIIFAEYNLSCRQAVQAWIQESPEAFDWSAFSSVVAKLEKADRNPSARLRDKIRAVVPCDYRQSAPLSPNWFPLFDVLSVGAVIETTCQSNTEFSQGITNVVSLLKPQGYFVGYFSNQCSRWTNGKRIYRCFPVSQDAVKQQLLLNGMEILKMTEVVGADYNQDYQGIFAVLARKR